MEHESIMRLWHILAHFAWVSGGEYSCYYPATRPASYPINAQYEQSSQQEVGLMGWAGKPSMINTVYDAIKLALKKKAKSVINVENRVSCSYCPSRHGPCRPRLPRLYVWRPKWHHWKRRNACWKYCQDDDDSRIFRLNLSPYRMAKINRPCVTS